MVRFGPLDGSGAAGEHAAFTPRDEYFANVGWNDAMLTNNGGNKPPLRGRPTGLDGQAHGIKEPVQEHLRPLLHRRHQSIERISRLRSDRNIGDIGGIPAGQTDPKQPRVDWSAWHRLVFQQTDASRRGWIATSCSPLRGYPGVQGTDGHCTAGGALRFAQLATRTD